MKISLISSLNSSFMDLLIISLHVEVKGKVMRPVDFRWSWWRPALMSSPLLVDASGASDQTVSSRTHWGRPQPTVWSLHEALLTTLTHTYCPCEDHAKWVVDWSQVCCVLCFNRCHCNIAGHVITSVLFAQLHISVMFKCKYKIKGIFTSWPCLLLFIQI